MDELCFKYNLPLFESGTTGTKGNTQPVIPFITETYSNSSDPEQEKSFPICTIKSFPNEIFHTIHWAMDQFEFFNRAPTTLNKWITNPRFIEELNPIEKTIAINDIYELIIKHPIQKQGIQECCKWAVDMFTENYYTSIIKLLDTFPSDHEISPGIKFWSAGKRCPKSIKFDPDNLQHFNYIKVTTYLLFRILDLEYNFTDNELYQIIYNYTPLELNSVTNDSEIKNNLINQTLEESKQIIIPQEFDKDNDLNGHIDWITSVSNMRAINYGIPIIDRQQTKGIAGRIIPAIATTTSAVSGLILLEMLKYLMGSNKINNYRSTFINLAEPTLVYSEPLNAPMIEIGGVKVNSWAKFEYSKDTPLREFKKLYDEIFKTNINMIVIGTSIIYADFIGSDSLDRLLSDLIKETLEIEIIPPNISINLATDDDKELPVIILNLF
jgi:ubiquitin-activating enzyme E1